MSCRRTVSGAFAELCGASMKVGQALVNVSGESTGDERWTRRGDTLPPPSRQRLLAGLHTGGLTLLLPACSSRESVCQRRWEEMAKEPSGDWAWARAPCFRCRSWMRSLACTSSGDGQEIGGGGIVIETVQASAGLLANRSPPKAGGGLRNGTFLAGEACLLLSIPVGLTHPYQCTMVPEHTK